MEQACFDTLFNKSKWHDPSKERRRAVHMLAAGTSARGCDISIVQGADVSFTFQLSDPFGVFPLDLRAILSPPPPGWWFKGVDWEVGDENAR